MSTDLRSALRAEAVKFADQFYEAAMRLFSSQISELFGAAPLHPAPETAPAKAPKTGRRSRLSADEIERTLTSTLELLAKRPKGLRLEGIKAELKLEGGLLKRAISSGLESGRIQKTGDRRATTYFLPTTPSPAQAAGRVVRRKK